jgi:3-dehydroquinate dehydratase/shikimate dehydrogenase
MSTQRLCVTVTGSDMADLRRRRDAVSGADLVELRLDTVSDPDAAGALAGRRLPVIVTCRPTWEGGAFAGSEEARKRLLAEALTAGAEYVDVEARAGFDDLIATTGGKRIVLSAHDFGGLPVDLETRVRTMRRTGAEVVKVAVTVTRLSDCVTLRGIAARTGEGDGLVLIGMGDHGVITRVLPSRFWSRWSYAGLLAGVGQLTPERLLTELRFRDLGPATSLYGVVGSPVSHSVSPAMHNAAFRAAGVDAVYLPLPAAEVDDFVTFARVFGVKGASVTIPHKVAMFECVEETSEIAKRIGAINTVRIDHGRWQGDNSDVEGFLKPLGHQPLTNARAALLGAGGAARGVAIALASRGAGVSVHARNSQRAAEVAALVSGSVGAFPPPRGSWDLLVNCTPVGMYPHVDETPLPAGSLGPGLVYDLVYNPPATRLLREAEGAGCRTIGGLEMLVGQARRQFEWWTGVQPSASVMRQAAIEKLQQFTHDTTINAEPAESAETGFSLRAPRPPR